MRKRFCNYCTGIYENFKTFTRIMQLTYDRKLAENYILNHIDVWDIVCLRKSTDAKSIVYQW